MRNKQELTETQELTDQTNTSVRQPDKVETPPETLSIAPSTVISITVPYNEFEDEENPGTPQTTESSLIKPDDLSDEGYAESTSSSFVTTIASNIRKGIVEDGRKYAAYGQNKPWVPIDDLEVSYVATSPICWY